MGELPVISYGRHNCSESVHLYVFILLDFFVYLLYLPWYLLFAQQVSSRHLCMLLSPARLISALNMHHIPCLLAPPKTGQGSNGKVRGLLVLKHFFSCSFVYLFCFLSSNWSQGADIAEAMKEDILPSWMPWCHFAHHTMLSVKVNYMIRVAWVKKNVLLSISWQSLGYHSIHSRKV